MPMPPPVDVVTVRGAFGPSDAAPLRERLDASFDAGTRWVAIDLSVAADVDVAALVEVALREGVVVCGGPEALLRDLTAAGVVATPRLLDVRIAARAQRGDGLKRRFELLELPRF